MYDLIWRLPPVPYLAVEYYRHGNRALPFFAITAIAISVGLTSALQMASTSIETELAQTAAAFAGSAQLEVSAAGSGVPEEVLEDVRSVPGVRAAAPITHQTFYLEDGFQLHVIGIDFLAEDRVHEHRIRSEGIEVDGGKLLVPDPLRLISGVTSIAITEALAERFGLEEGDTLAARAPFGDVDLVVRGILYGGGLARAYGGQIAAMDVYTLQGLSGRGNLLDRISISVEPARNLETVRADLVRAVAGRAEIRNAEQRDQWVEQMRATLTLGVMLAAILGISVAALVSYTAISMSVEQRQESLRILRSSGLLPSRLRRLLLFEALGLGLVGTALGIPLGALAARIVLGAFSNFSSVLASVRFDDTSISATTIAVACVVGIGISTIGSIAPTRRATRLRPFEREDPARIGGVSGPPSIWLLGSVAALLILLGLLLADSVLAPELRLILIVVASATLLAVSTTAWLRPALRRMEPLIDRLFPRIGSLVGASLAARPRQAGYAICSVAMLVAGSLCITSTIRSVTGAVDEWIAGVIRDAILVTPGSPFELHRVFLESPTLEAIRQTPGVDALSEQFYSTALYRGEQVGLHAYNWSTRRAHDVFVDGSSEEIRKRLLQGQVVVSEGFARRFGVGREDSIELSTPAGRRAFKIAGIRRDIDPAGAIALDIAIFDRYWTRRGASSALMWTSEPVEGVLDRVRSRTHDKQSLLFMYGEEYHHYATQLARRFSRLYYALGALAAILGGASVANLLLGSVIQRSDEFARLHLAGMTKRQVIRMLQLDCLVVAMTGAISGLVFGALWTIPLIRTMSGSFDLTIRYQASPLEFAVAVSLAAGLAIAAGSYPAFVATRHLGGQLPHQL